MRRRRNYSPSLSAQEAALREIYTKTADDYAEAVIGILVSRGLDPEMVRKSGDMVKVKTAPGPVDRTYWTACCFHQRSTKTPKSPQELVGCKIVVEMPISANVEEKQARKKGQLDLVAIADRLLELREVQIQEVELEKVRLAAAAQHELNGFRMMARLAKMFRVPKHYYRDGRYSWDQYCPRLKLSEVTELKPEQLDEHYCHVVRVSCSFDDQNEDGRLSLKGAAALTYRLWNQIPKDIKADICFNNYLTVNFAPMTEAQAATVLPVLRNVACEFYGWKPEEHEFNEEDYGIPDPDQPDKDEDEEETEDNQSGADQDQDNEIVEVAS